VAWQLILHWAGCIIARLAPAGVNHA